MVQRLEMIKDGASRLQTDYEFTEGEAIELAAIEAGYESFAEVVGLVEGSNSMTIFLPGQPQAVL